MVGTNKMTTFAEDSPISYLTLTINKNIMTKQMKRLGTLCLLLMLAIVSRADDFKDFSVIVNNQDGTLLTADEISSKAAVSFGVAVGDDGNVSRVAADDAKAIATVSGTYTPGAYDNYILYVETTGAPTLDFQIRYFRVKAPQGTAAAADHPDQEIPVIQTENGELPSLKETYAGYFDFGTCVPGMQARNAKAMAFNLTQFSILTPENELKPDAVLDVAASKRLSAQDETAVRVT